MCKVNHFKILSVFVNLRNIVIFITILSVVDVVLFSMSSIELLRFYSRLLIDVYF